MAARTITRRDLLRLLEGATALSAGIAVTGCTGSQTSSSDDGSDAVEEAVDLTSGISIADLAVYQTASTTGTGCYVLTCSITNDNDVACMMDTSVSGVITYTDADGAEQTIDAELETESYSSTDYFDLCIGANATEKKCLLISGSKTMPDDADDWAFPGSGTSLSDVAFELHDVEEFFLEDYEYLPQNDIEVELTAADDATTIVVTNNTDVTWSKGLIGFCELSDDRVVMSSGGASFVRYNLSGEDVAPGETASLAADSLDADATLVSLYSYYIPADE